MINVTSLSMVWFFVSISLLITDMSSFRWAISSCKRCVSSLISLILNLSSPLWWLLGEWVGEWPDDTEQKSKSLGGELAQSLSKSKEWPTVSIPPSGFKSSTGTEHFGETSGMLCIISMVTSPGNTVQHTSKRYNMVVTSEWDDDHNEKIASNVCISTSPGNTSQHTSKRYNMVVTSI